MKYGFTALIVIAVLLEVGADILFKKWASEHPLSLITIGTLPYLGGTIIWAYSLQFEYLSKAITVFTVLNLILVVLAGVVIFKEDLSLINKIGIVLGIISVVLIQI